MEFTRRNPLKSGQCFLHKRIARELYPILPTSRNPLKSGQCFLRGEKGGSGNCPCRNPLKSGQCFLLGIFEREGGEKE